MASLNLKKRAALSKAEILSELATRVNALQAHPHQNLLGIFSDDECMELQRIAVRLELLSDKLLERATTYEKLGG